jgi:hypothetical protein
MHWEMKFLDDEVKEKEWYRPFRSRRQHEDVCRAWCTGGVTGGKRDLRSVTQTTRLYAPVNVNEQPRRVAAPSNSS